MREEEEDLPFGPPTRMYKYRCSRCKFESEMNDINVGAAYAWTKKRTTTSDGEEVPVMECPMCDRMGEKTFICID